MGSLKKVIPQLAIEDEKYYFSQRAVEGMKNAKNNMKRGLYQDLNGQCLTITSHLAKTSLNSRETLFYWSIQKRNLQTIYSKRSCKYSVFS
jgi:DNA (cytosine-5)-methyltransferase 1